MKIRKATIKDAEGVAVVLKESYNIDSVSEGKEVFESEMKKNMHYLVAEEDEKIIGLTTWVEHGLQKHGLVELDRIAVLPDFRGKGVSRELFAALKDDAKKELGKIRKLFLLTHESNKRAHSFYEKIGLKHEVTLKKHYYDNEDERVYSMFF